MLSLTDKFTIPGISNVDFYFDHKKRDTFYAIRSTPLIKRDQDNKLAFSYNLIARNAEIAYASSANKDLVETQLGQLLLTVDLALTDDEEKTALDYLRKMLNNNKKSPLLRRHLRRYRLKPQTKKIEPKIAAPNWKNGTVTLNVLSGFGDTFTKSSSEVVKPSLVGWNSASLYASYGVEAASLMYQALSEGVKDDEGNNEKTPLLATVNYTGLAIGYIANMEIKVFARSTDVYNFLETQNNEFIRDVKQGRRTRTRKFMGKTVYKKTTTFDRKVDIDKSEIHSLVETMRQNKVIRVEVNDDLVTGERSQEEKEAQQALMANIMDMVTNTIIKTFFETAFIEDENTSEEGTTPQAGPGSTSEEAKKFDHVKDQNHSYYFKNDISRNKISNISFHFKKNSTVEFQVNPSGSLLAQLTDSERKAAVRILDVSSPEIQMLEVQVKVNADFETDNIHSVIVNLSYKQKDHKTGIVRQNARSFLFENGTEVHTFRVSMARNANGELIDYYKAEAKISYRGTADAPPPIVLDNISDRVLNISYDKLGFITTKVSVGDIDWAVVKEAIVDLEYIAEPNKPDSKKQIRLTQESPLGNWKCFMYGHKDKSYRYKKKWIYLDGTQSESEYITDTRETLVIDDDLVGRVKASFDVLMDPNYVTAAKVEVLYKDEANAVNEEFSKWFTGSETWDWNMRLREGASNQFQYRYFAQFTDGLVKTSEWKTATSDENIDPIDLKRYKKTLTVDGGMLDWTKWKVVYVNVQHNDLENKYLKEETIRITSEDFMKTFEIMAFSPGSNVFEYTLKFAGNDQMIDLDAETIKGGILLLKNPEGTDQPIVDPLPPEDSETDNPIITP